ncbi:hypothetical protein OAJ27_02045 [bacterium]|nr:hypothetical protein [bacterium]
MSSAIAIISLGLAVGLSGFGGPTNLSFFAIYALVLTTFIDPLRKLAAKSPTLLDSERFSDLALRLPPTPAPATPPTPSGIIVSPRLFLW